MSEATVTDQLNQKSRIRLVRESHTIHRWPASNGDSLKKSHFTEHRVFAESDGDDFLIPGLDQFEDPDTFDATYPVISMDLAATVAEANVDFAIDSNVTVVWFQTNSPPICAGKLSPLADRGEP